MDVIEEYKNWEQLLTMDMCLTCESNVVSNGTFELLQDPVRFVLTCQPGMAQYSRVMTVYNTKLQSLIQKSQ